ncbi:hypothetical protein EV646_10329 [Kribbella antiqua]|uniref:Uncharacterized protein n=1 Tax=Kribbella antiqua TaxID=2512217 RepID=A0A4R2IW18_9ACTN|nr:hypothetical protein [Kribbella antiqua]TCO49052.1 hypothetical protein EV646_10329 [Kribbella antiqua]
MKPQSDPERVLIVGRSPSVLLEAVEILRGRGFLADATNQFDSVLDEYDVAELDIVVFGGQVPPDTKQYLREQIAATNPDTTFIQGLAGIPGLIAAQVAGAGQREPANESVVSYDTERRVVQLNLDDPAHVTIDAYWHTSLTPPEPKSTSLQVLNTELAKGSHSVPLPAEVPSEAAFVTATAGTTVHAFTASPMPQRVAAGGGASSLPPVAPVTTHNHN